MVISAASVMISVHLCYRGRLPWTSRTVQIRGRQEDTPMAWTAEDMPDLRGKTIIVTGGNSGIGLEAARQFARKGANVVLACRDENKAKAAAAELQRESPDVEVETLALDLASLESVRRAAAEFKETHRQLHA